MTEEKQFDEDFIFVIMMIIGVLGVIFAYPTEIMDFLVYSIVAIATTKIIQIAMIATGIGGFIFFMIHRMLHWSP